MAFVALLGLMAAVLVLAGAFCMVLLKSPEEKRDHAVSHPLPLGQTAKVGDLELAVERWETGGAYEGPAYSVSPSPGKMFLWVLVSMKNIGQLENKEGLQINLIYAGNENWGGAAPPYHRPDPKHRRLDIDMPGYCELQPQEEIRGWEGFEVSSDADPTEAIVLIEIDDCAGWDFSPGYRAWRLASP